MWYNAKSIVQYIQYIMFFTGRFVQKGLFAQHIDNIPIFTRARAFFAFFLKTGKQGRQKAYGRPFLFSHYVLIVRKNHAC